MNGIPTGTNYTVAFGDKWSEAIVELRRKEAYSVFVDKLWRAVCVRLLTELIESLKSGRKIRFGEATITDDSVTLVKHVIWGARIEAPSCSWQQVTIWNAGGVFYIGMNDDKKIYVGLSYINEPNTHILEEIIRLAFKKPGMRKLSDILE